MAGARAVIRYLVITIKCWPYVFFPFPCRKLSKLSRARRRQPDCARLVMPLAWPPPLATPPDAGASYHRAHQVLLLYRVPSSSTPGADEPIQPTCRRARAFLPLACAALVPSPAVHCASLPLACAALVLCCALRQLAQVGPQGWPCKGTVFRGAGLALFLWSTTSYYHHNAAIYGQNKHAHANLRRIMGIE